MKLRYKKCACYDCDEYGYNLKAGEKKEELWEDGTGKWQHHGAINIIDYDDAVKLFLSARDRPDLYLDLFRPFAIEKSLISEEALLASKDPSIALRTAIITSVYESLRLRLDWHTWLFERIFQ